MSGTRALLLWLGIVAAPLAWFGQLTIGYEAVEGGCAPEGGRGDVFGTVGVESAALVVTVVAVVLACVGLLAALVTWRADSAAEYLRFLGFISLLGSLLLLTAIVLSGVGIVALETCGQA